jgi:hypothetical protein
MTTASLTMIDTHASIKKLVAVGFTERQAEVLVEEHTRLADDQLATKQDIKGLKHDIKELELRMTIKMGGMMVVIIGVLAALKLV